MTLTLSMVIHSCFWSSRGTNYRRRMRVLQSGISYYSVTAPYPPNQKAGILRCSPRKVTTTDRNRKLLRETSSAVVTNGSSESDERGVLCIAYGVSGYILDASLQHACRQHSARPEHGYKERVDSSHRRCPPNGKPFKREIQYTLVLCWLPLLQCKRFKPPGNANCQNRLFTAGTIHQRFVKQ
jgi:hypothetical protein